MLDHWIHILTFIWIMCCIYLITIQSVNRNDRRTSYFQQNEILRVKIDKISITNAEISDQISALNELLKYQNSFEGHQPSEDYEYLRRRIYSNTKEFWYYANAEFNALETLVEDMDALNFLRVKQLAHENYMSLLLDNLKLADVDQHSRWRQQMFDHLSGLVQWRLNRLQNPLYCKGAKKLICNSTFIDSDCGFTCRVHILLNCLVIAYVNGRTLIVPAEDGWLMQGDEWESLFLPLSDTCLTSHGQTTLKWPGNEDAQVLWLDISHFIDSRNPHYPFEIPEDLAPALRVLHGDPVVWWIGQFLKFILRPRPSTSQMLDGLFNDLKFQTPIVGLQISKDLKHPPHRLLSEYMSHVEEYYKIKEMESGYEKKRIYLSTYDPKLLNKLKHKYPNYEIISVVDLPKKFSSQEDNANRTIHNIIIDLYFLSRCDYLVCTFSFDMGRMAYEMMNTLHPDAPIRFTSLDGIYNYPGKMRRLNVAVIPHEPTENGEIELQQGDLISLSNNHRNGSSSGTSLRTHQTGLFPSFKVTPKVETKNYPYYPAAVGNNDKV